jgi:hypothetical protein
MADCPKLNVLLYCNRPNDSENAGTIIDHIDAFAKYSRNNVTLWSSMKRLPSLDTLRKFDCIVIHYTLSLLYEKYISSESLEKIRKFKGLKVMFIQDEYRRVNFVCDKIRYARIDLVHTCAPPDVAAQIYESLEGKVALSTTLTGYVPEKLSGVKTKPLDKRSIAVGYRARKCPFFLGRKSHEKYLIGKLFLEKTKGHELRNDVSSSEKDRIYGEKWIEFLSNCKATLGTESGASIIDFTGEIEYKLNRWQAFHPFGDFEDVPAHLLEEDGQIELQVISPRCFEAASLGTVMIMYPGDYSGILKPGVHYISLEKDFSNIDEVTQAIKDTDFLETIANNARSELIDSGKYSFESFVTGFDDSLELLAKEKKWEAVGECLSLPDSSSPCVIESVKNEANQGNTIMKWVRKVWKNSPTWIRFILMVTFLRKSYYSHLYELKDRYRIR